jgi:hypothetical protein
MTREDDEALLTAITQWRNGVASRDIGAALDMTPSGVRGTISRIAQADISNSEGRDKAAACRHWGRTA